jgi:acetyltransferase-like isoleucine patch superfamily enzyme
MRKLAYRLAAQAEYCAIVIKGLLFGCSPVIRYLRNPNPLITAKLLRRFGAQVGEHATLKGSIFVDNVFDDSNSTGDFSHLTIGRNCYVGDCVFFDLADNIVLGDNSVIAGKASLVTHSECKRSSYINERFPRKSAPIVLGSGAWIGFGVTVLNGVTIGQNCVIGSSALVNESTDPYGVYVGAPARKIKTIENLSVEGNQVTRAL